MKDTNEELPCLLYHPSGKYNTDKLAQLIKNEEGTLFEVRRNKQTGLRQPYTRRPDIEAHNVLNKRERDRRRTNPHELLPVPEDSDVEQESSAPLSDSEEDIVEPVDNSIRTFNIMSSTLTAPVNVNTARGGGGPDPNDPYGNNPGGGPPGDGQPGGDPGDPPVAQGCYDPDCLLYSMTCGLVM